MPCRPPPSTGPLKKQGEGYLLHTDVEEVVLNATVLERHATGPEPHQGRFQVFEDGVKQTLISFQHTDLPVSIGLVVDNSGSMYRKRPSVNKSALDLIQASNPQDEAFVVNFSDEAFIDCDFTSDINKLRDGLSHIDSRGGTALYDAVVASADKLVADAKRPKQVLILITDGEDNASTLTLEQTIRRVQQLSGPVIYSIGLLFGDEMSRAEVRHARRALEMLSTETGGMAFFPKSIEQVDQIAAEVARDIRSQYTLGYHSTKPIHRAGIPPRGSDSRGQGHGQTHRPHPHRLLPGGAHSQANRRGGKIAGMFGATAGGSSREAQIARNAVRTLRQAVHRPPRRPAHLPPLPGRIDRAQGRQRPAQGGKKIVGLLRAGNAGEATAFLLHV